MAYFMFAPNFAFDADLPLELAFGTEVPKHIDEFWLALPQVAFSRQPHIEGGLGTVHLPLELPGAFPDIQGLWCTLRPTIVQILAEHPTLVGRRQGRYGQPPSDAALLAHFGDWMTDTDPATGRPRWQLFETRPDSDQSYVRWLLQALFDNLTRAGFPI